MAFALVLTSCKDFLDVAPTNQAASEICISNADDAKVMLNGLYNAMTSSSFYGRNFVIYGDLKTDHVTVESNGRGYDYMYAYQHSATSGTMSGFWSTGYNTIMLCNNIIEGCAKLDDAEADEYAAQAQTIRAMFHYDLARLYGKCWNDDKTALAVPIVNETVPAGAQLPRNTVAEVYDFVLAELDAAAPRLSKSKEDGFMNYYGNRAIKARALMDMENYAGALQVAEEIINSGKYSLYTPDEWVDSWAEQFGSESIIEIGMYVNEGDNGSTGDIGCVFIIGGGNNKNPQYMLAGLDWLDRMYEDPTDVRLGVMGEDDIRESALEGDELKTVKMERRHGSFGSCWKYRGGLEGKGDGKASNSAVNVKLCRLSEIYLIAAEAALQSNNKAKAAEYTNEIRKRSPALPAYTEATITRKAILDEKSKEFFSEGIRYWDLIRTNSTIEMDDYTTDVVVTTRETSFNRSFYKCILPMYKDEMNANPNIVQNPGY